MTPYIIVAVSAVVVTLAIEPIAKRWTLRRKFWRAAHDLTSRRYRAAVHDDIVQQEARLIDYEYAELSQSYHREGQ